MITKKNKIYYRNKKISLKKQKGGSLNEESLNKYVKQKMSFFTPEYEINPIKRLIEIYSKVSSPSELRISGHLHVIPKPLEQDLINNTSKNIEIFQNVETSKLTGNSVICYSDIKAKIITGYSRVPLNTIVCFLSPLDNKIYNNPRDSTTKFESIMHKINSTQYTNLFKFRTMMRYADAEIIKNTDSDFPSFYYSCFKNSYWYYPSQIFPNMSYDILSQDDSSSYYRVMNSEGDISEPILNVNRLKVGQSHNLINLVRCHERTEDFRLIIVKTSRNLDNYLPTQEILDLEMITYHLNRKFDDKDINHIIFENVIESKCGFIEHEIENIIFHDTKTLGELKFRNKNSNLDGFTPSLQDIFETVKYYVEKYKGARYIKASLMSNNDAKYLSSLSPKLIVKFLFHIFEKIDSFERMRLNNLFIQMEFGVQKIIQNLYGYISQSIEYLVYFKEVSSQEHIFKFIKHLCEFIHHNEFLYRDVQLNKLKSHVKKISKGSKFIDLILRQKPGNYLRIKSSEIDIFQRGENREIDTLYLIIDKPLDFTSVLNDNLKNLTIEFQIPFTIPFQTALNKLLYLKLVGGNYNLSDIKRQCHKLKILIIENYNKTVNLQDIPPNLNKLTLDNCKLKDISVFNKMNKLYNLEVIRSPIPIQITNPKIKDLILERVLPEIIITRNLNILEIIDIDFSTGGITLPLKIEKLKLKGCNLLQNQISNDCEIKYIEILESHVHLSNIQKLYNSSEKSLKVLTLKKCELASTFFLKKEIKINTLTLIDNNFILNNNIVRENLPESLNNLILLDNTNLTIDPFIIKDVKKYKKIMIR